ncbi:hypothetical protein GCM10023169_11580 [Georgenia halophila]|uniref:Uncharacterized protein n=1 Tax=Georgenia halophila TaxID=620889 RepID=A0ABP8KUM4_9MICO
MTRRIISVALIVLGLVAVLAAIASATIWRPTDTATLSLPSRPDAPVVVSDPGVLDAVAPEVTIRATAGDDQPVTLAIGRSADVDAWVGEAAHQRITGLASWEQLEVGTSGAESPEATDEASPTGEGTEQATEATSPTEGSTEESTGNDGEGESSEGETTVPNPAGSDLWVAEQTGTGSAEMQWTDQEGRWSLLAATDGAGPAPEVSLTWPVEVRTPWLVPGIIAGAVLMLLGIGLLILQIRADRRVSRRAATVDARADETAVITAVGSEDTRREHGRRSRRSRRDASPEATAAAALDDTSTTDTTTRAVDEAGTARGAGILPASPRAAELRTARDPDQRSDGDASDDARCQAELDHQGSTDHEGTAAHEGTAGADEGARADDATPTAPASGWRAMWGFGTSSETSTDEGPADDEGKEQR